jgi:hypothetical protein
MLALSVGAFAYPVVVGTHPLSAVHTGSPATVNHPQTGDNSTGNETSGNETGDHQAPPAGNETDNETADNESADNETAPIPPPPEANETENETDTSNISVEHNVTVTQQDNTTWVNGTIIVMNGTTTLVDFTFQIVVHDNGTANVTINGTQVSGSDLISVHGFAVFSAERNTLNVFGVAADSQNGTVLWQRPFAFELGSDCSYGA